MCNVKQLSWIASLVLGIKYKGFFRYLKRFNIITNLSIQKKDQQNSHFLNKVHKWAVLLSV